LRAVKRDEKGRVSSREDKQAEDEEKTNVLQPGGKVEAATAERSGPESGDSTSEDLGCARVVGQRNQGLPSTSEERQGKEKLQRTVSRFVLLNNRDLLDAVQSS
jgi:hypothetical protein